MSTYYKGYSWREKKEAEKNKKTATIFFITTFVLITLFVTFGLPFVVKFAAFLSDLRGSSQSVTPGDTTPPPPPTIFSLAKFTNSENLEIKGYGEPGATIVVDINNETKDILSGADGNFALEVKLKEGENKFVAYAIDSSKNESKKTQEYSVVYDKTPPKLEIAKPSDGSKSYGQNQRQITVEGFTDTDSIVNISGSRAVVGSDGKFSISTGLSEGENVFNISAQDIAGNKEERNISVYFYP